MGNDAFQEVDIIGMVKGVTKYSVTVRKREDLGRIIKMAFHIATSGKPGPVLIDLPKNIQVEKGPSDYPGEINIRGYKINTNVHVGQLKRAYKLLSGAKRPLIMAGGGIRISKAHKQLEKFVEKTKVPVVTTVMGKGAMKDDNFYYIGNCGMHGRYSANKAVSECDVLLSIGTRFNDRITGDLNEFAPKAKIIHIDIDTASISRNVVVDIPIVADAKKALEKLIEWAEPIDSGSWMNDIYKWEEEHPLFVNQGKYLSPQVIMEHINKNFTKAIYVTDVGQHQMWASQYITLDEKKSMICSGGLGTMGFGFPAAVGAKLAKPDMPVVCITGDGGFQMNMQEMATAIIEGAPVIVCILNNTYLGMVRQFQELFYGKRYASTSLLTKADNNTKNTKGVAAGDKEAKYIPDFIKWAESYGALGIRVESESEIDDAFSKAKKNTKTPTVIEFITEREELVLPMVKGGNPLSEMILP